MSKSPNKAMINRARVIGVFMIIAALVLIGFLAYHQIIKHEFYQSRAISQQTLDIALPANRGDITDRNGVVLAKSSTVQTVYIAPKEMEKPEEKEATSRALSEIFGIEYEEILEKAQKTNYYEKIKRKVESDVVEQVKKVQKERKLKGIHFSDDSKRYYPYNNLASHIIGFVDIDNKGLEGIESRYNSYLQGVNGKRITAKNNKGTALPGEYEVDIPAQDGNNLKLTIDYTIQHYLEKHIEQARQDNKCMNGAAGIIMDVNTFEILAMTSKPDYNLNNNQLITDSLLTQELENFVEPSEDEELPANAPKTKEEKEKHIINKMHRNKLIVDTYEPGSTFKILTAAMALEENVVSENSSFYCSGSHRVANYNIACWKHGGHGAQNFVQALQNSCNPAFMTIAASITTDPFFEYFKNFGMTERTGIDLIGEANGIFHSKTNFNEVELATASFGQRFKVTPIQMITAIAAVANGGNLGTPHVVKEITSKDEKGNATIVESFSGGIKRQVVSDNTSEMLCKYLESVVSIGSGKNAYVKGYRVAGKTGTSEKLENESTTGEEEYIASFIGFAPADDPQIAILVMLDEPSAGEYFGGLTAAPVAGNILADVLPYLEITPEYTQEELASLDTAVPSVGGLSTEQAVSLIKEKGLDYKIIGGEGTVEHQIPKSGTSIPRTGTVVLYTNGKDPSKTITVPDVTNMSVAGAAKMLSNYGLNFRAVGNESTKNTALIKSQSPAAGEKVEAGTVVTVNYKNYDDVSN